MDNAIALLSIAAAMLVGAMSPGPSFLMIARTAVAASRADGFAAALGMGVGGVIFALAALLGLRALFTSVPLLYVLLKVAGGAYLLYIGYRIWRGAREPLQVAHAHGSTSRQPWRSFALGLATQLTNPKTAIAYAGIFAALLPREIEPWLLVALPAIIFSTETLWYGIVVVALSAPASRAAYLRCKFWLDRIAGGLMALLGVRLVVTAAEP